MSDDFLSDDDLETWQYVARTVKPMPGKEISYSDEKKDEKIEVKVNREYIEQLVGQKTSPEEKTREYKYLQHGTTEGIDKSTARRLKEGKYQIDARLDMHGRTQDEALEGLRYFVKTSYEMGKRCVLVITGKGAGGDGVLKSQMPRWLNMAGVREYVLSFSYASPKHGGNGALYVLIRKKK